MEYTTYFPYSDEQTVLSILNLWNVLAKTLPYLRSTLHVPAFFLLDILQFGFVPQNIQPVHFQ